MRYNQELAIKMINEKHPELDTSKFVYETSKTNSIIICPIHGEVETSFEKLLKSKKGCLKCAHRSKITPEEAIENMKNKFPQFDYSKFVYKDRYSKSIVICPKHGEFLADYKNFINHQVHGCKKCAAEYLNKSQKKDINEVLDTLYKKYPNLDFSKFEYVNYNSKSTVICPKHGEFQSSYSELVSDRVKYGCPKCGRIISDERRLLGRDYMIDKLTKKYPDLIFSKFNPRKTTDLSTVICHIHGEFESCFDYMMLKGLIKACPNCSTAGTSTPEKEIVDYIKSIYSNTIIENDRSVIPSIRNNKYFMELDIYLPDAKLAIEFNGSYWHTDESISKRTNGVFKTAKEYHDYKLEKCNEKGIKLIFIEEQDYRNNKVKILKEIKHNIL